jgi:hypothetical protein
VAARLYVGVDTLKKHLSRVLARTDGEPKPVRPV